jgi:hypothetical protein
MLLGIVACIYLAPEAELEQHEESAGAQEL